MQYNGADKVKKRIIAELEKYYQKSETYSQAEINDIIATINKFNVQVVNELPTTDIDTHCIYFVPKTEPNPNDEYDEYIYIGEKWEHIGSTSIDLSEYVKKSDYPFEIVNGVVCFVFEEENLNG